MMFLYSNKHFKLKLETSISYLTRACTFLSGKPLGLKTFKIFSNYV